MSRHFAHNRLHFLGRIVLLAILTIGGAYPVFAGSIPAVLQSWIDEGPQEREIPVWVFFVDRGFENEQEHAEALRQAQERLSDAALARRARVGKARVDDQDLPVCQQYRESIAQIGRIRQESRWLNAVSAWIFLGRMTDAASLPFVERIRPVARGRAQGIGPERGPDGQILGRIDREARGRMLESGKRDDPYGPSYDQLDEIDVLAAHAAGYTGARVRLMMIDTGFRKDHEAFFDSDILAEYDFVFGDGDVQNEAIDDQNAHNHGTVTWGAAGGYAPGSLVGPAFGATFLLAKTEDIRSELPVEEDNYIAALEWGDPLGVMVTSASLTYKDFDDGSGWTYEDLDGDSPPITRAIDRAAAVGILCVNAMGNAGPGMGSLGEPADADTMLACGSVNSFGEISVFSSRGPRVDGMIKPEVVARGEYTWTADPLDPQGYGPASGTSLSTPLVGGSVAIVMEAHPEWTLWQARGALMETAQRWGPPDNDYGYGRIQVWAAIQSEPMVVPAPFSLVTPGEGEAIPEFPTTFVWNRSQDPGGGEILYELWLDADPGFVSPVVYAGISDTSFTVVDPALPDSTLYWRVLAEEPDGYRRLCREDRFLRAPSGVEDLPLGFAWSLGAHPNPSTDGSQLRLRWFAPEGNLGTQVSLTIFSAAGRRLFRETMEVSSIGWNEWVGESRTANGSDLPAGVYLASLATPGRTVRTKFVLTR